MAVGGCGQKPISLANCFKNLVGIMVLIFLPERRFLSYLYKYKVFMNDKVMEIVVNVVRNPLILILYRWHQDDVVKNQYYMLIFFRIIWNYGLWGLKYCFSLQGFLSYLYQYKVVWCDLVTET